MICTADEGQRVLRAKTIKAREVAAKQEQVRSARQAQQRTRRELKILVRSEVTAHVTPKLTNAKKAFKSKHDALQRKLKALQDSVTNLGELEHQLEELRTEVTDSMEEQEVSHMLACMHACIHPRAHFHAFIFSHTQVRRDRLLKELDTKLGETVQKLAAGFKKVTASLTKKNKKLATDVTKATKVKCMPASPTPSLTHTLAHALCTSLLPHALAHSRV